MTDYELIHAAPHAPSLFSAPLKWLELRRQQIINRRAFQRMLSLDEHMLKDIGVTRGDVIWASNLPLSCNAARELHAHKSARRW